MNLQLGAVISGSVISVMMIIYKVLLTIFCVQSSTVHFNLPRYAPWLFLAIFVYVAFSYPAIYAEVCSVVSILCVEFRALSDDFADDVNTYQLPVIKHYVAAHWKIAQSHELFEKSLRCICAFICST